MMLKAYSSSSMKIGHNSTKSVISRKTSVVATIVVYARIIKVSDRSVVERSGNSEIVKR